MKNERYNAITILNNTDNAVVTTIYFVSLELDYRSRPYRCIAKHSFYVHPLHDHVCHCDYIVITTEIIYYARSNFVAVVRVCK